MGGIAPITAFKAFVQRDPISAVYEPAGVHRIALFNERELSTLQRQHMKEYELTLDSVHNRVSEVSRKKNEAAQRRHEFKKMPLQWILKFAISYYQDMLQDEKTNWFYTGKALTE